LVSKIQEELKGGLFMTNRKQFGIMIALALGAWKIGKNG